MAEQSAVQGAEVPGDLTEGARRLVQAAREMLAGQPAMRMGSYHWLVVLLTRHAAMAEAMVADLRAAELRHWVHAKLREGEVGQPLDEAEALTMARQQANARGRTGVAEQDLAAAVLSAAGYTLGRAIGPPAIASTPSPSKPSTTPIVAAGSPPPSTPSASPQAASPGAAARPDAAPSEWHPRATRPTPTLDQFGRDLTNQARSGLLWSIVGREAETDLVVETLCRTTKRNPVLIGPAGVGKTAIIEGLAQRMIAGDVPALIRDHRIIALQPSALVAGSGIVGELERRMKALLSEAAQDGILLFIDEIHTVVGAGGTRGSDDVASLLKPVLARGEIACIGATTDDEYRRYIEGDGALERRFQPVRVHELDRDHTRAVLLKVRDALQERRAVAVPDAILDWLVDFADEAMPNRYFPDKGVDLLEQCVAWAVANDRRSVQQADAEAIAQRMVGMPVGVGERLAILERALAERSLLDPSDARRLSDRLVVALRGLDTQVSRPNVVILLADRAAERADALAEVLASSLYGAADRIVPIDFGRMVVAYDLSMLVGAPPGYVGYSDTLPIHRIAQTPWCVVLGQNIDGAAPQIQRVVAQAIRDGYITDGSGKRIHLADTVVLFTIVRTSGPRRAIGFRAGAMSPGATSAPSGAGRVAVGDLLVQELLDACDLVVTDLTVSAEGLRRWLREGLLADLAGRFASEGLQVEFDESVLAWLLAQGHGRADSKDWARLLDEQLGPPLVAHLPQKATRRARVLVRAVPDRIVIEPLGRKSAVKARPVEARPAEARPADAKSQISGHIEKPKGAT